MGGGISGLTVAWHLHKAGIPFRLFEKEKETGGMISSSLDAGTVMDFGPNSLRDRNGEVRELAADLGLEDDLIQISEAFKTRYIVKNGALQSLKPNPVSLFTNKVLSGKGKLRALAEPFISRGDERDESIGSFLERRIGKEAVNYLVDPVFSGIYAGDIYSMSIKTILPELYKMERDHGSLLMGALRAKREKSTVKPMVLTFRKGIQQLTDAITQNLSDHISHAEVTAIQRTEQGYQVKVGEETIQAAHVVACIPAHALAPIIKGVSPEASDVLGAVDYAPMVSTQVVYEEDHMGSVESGFGFLVPRNEMIRLLGAIWKSSIFPELTDEGQIHFTLMTGGAHDHKVLNEPIERIEAEVLTEFRALMGISGEPLFVRSRLWAKAIPQFHVGYQEEIQARLDALEQYYPGFSIGGNYRWGVSVPDCMEGAKALADKISASIDNGE